MVDGLGQPPLEVTELDVVDVEIGDMNGHWQAGPRLFRVAQWNIRHGVGVPAVQLRLSPHCLASTLTDHRLPDGDYSPTTDARVLSPPSRFHRLSFSIFFRLPPLALGQLQPTAWHSHRHAAAECLPF
jgi:hypothetical protein